MGTRFKDDSRDPAVNVTNWVLLVTVILAVFARLGTKFRLFHKFDNADFLIIASLLLCVVQSVCVSMTVNYGYGKHFQHVNKDEFDVFLKYLYSGYIVYITSLCFSKLSMTAFIRNLTHFPKDRSISMYVGSTVVLWAIISIVGSIFQCAVPRVWDVWNGKCLNLVAPRKTAWRYFISVSNIVTEVLILGQGLLLTSRIQTSRTKRLLVALIFLSRGVVIGSIIIEIVLTHATAHTMDPTYELCHLTILQSLTQCLSIVTASYGQLKPLMDWFKRNELQIQEDRGGAAHKPVQMSGSHSASRDTRCIEGHENNDDFPSAIDTRILVTQYLEVNSHKRETKQSGD